MTSPFLILGAGGHAKVVAETALASGIASRIVFLDDRSLNNGKPIDLLGWPVTGPLAQALNPDGPSLFQAAAVAIGHSKTRLHWLRQLKEMGYQLPA